MFSISARSFWSRETLGGCPPSVVLMIFAFPDLSGGVDPLKVFRRVSKFWGVPHPHDPPARHIHTMFILDFAGEEPRLKFSQI